MMTAMDWSVLASTVMGGLLAGGGAFLGQWWADKRAREREREQWARDLRYKAHVQFLTIFDERWDRVAEARNLDDGPDPPYDYLASLWDQEQMIQLVSEPATFAAAAGARKALVAYCFRGGDSEDLMRARALYLNSVRDEFGLPKIPGDKGE